MTAPKALFASAGLWLCLGCAVLLTIWHISVGAKPIAFSVVWTALTAPQDGVFDHIVVRELRLPRALFALAVGAGLSVAGALMQGVTRNPLAEPAILGLMAGASCAVVLGIGTFELAGTAFIPVFAALGALMGAGMVTAIAQSAPGGATPLALILAGAAVSGFLMALQSAAILLDPQSFANFRLWLSGSLSGRDMATFLWTLPWFAAGLITALLVARQVTALAMGDETAIGLGVNILRIKLIALAAVVSLTAAAVSVAGPMGFVGLVIPHVVRLFVGSDYRLIVPFAALLGASYLVVVDIAARLLLAPVELSTGIVTTILGAPVFIWLVGKRL